MSGQVILIFLCGVANFAMHEATMQSGHPVIEQMQRSLGGALGGWGGYALEFAFLLGAMIFGAMDSAFAAPVYGGYTALNALAAWMLLSGRM